MKYVLKWHWIKENNQSYLSHSFKDKHGFSYKVDEILESLKNEWNWTQRS